MSDFKSMLQYLRKEKKLSQSELAKKLGLATSTIGMYETGKREPSFEILEVIADYFNVDMNFLLGKQIVSLHDSNNQSVTENTNIIEEIGGFEYKPTHIIPILGYISAGLPLYAEEHIEGYTFTELNSGGEYFALRVKGDSMNAVRIFDNDILIIRRQPTVENGEIAAVMVGDEDATVKRFYKNGNTITLMPQSNNPEHLPQVYNAAEIKIKVLGKVVENKISFD